MRDSLGNSLWCDNLRKKTEDKGHRAFDYGNKCNRMNTRASVKTSLDSVSHAFRLIN